MFTRSFTILNVPYPSNQTLLQNKLKKKLWRQKCFQATSNPSNVQTQHTDIIGQ